MKTFLTILIIFALLVFAIFVLLRRSKNDNELNDNDADYDHCPDSNSNPSNGEEIDNTLVEEEPVQEPIEEPVEEEPAVPEDYEDAGPAIESEEPVVLEGEEEINFQGCKDKEEKDIDIPNKYFFNVHEYTTAKHRSMFCVVCNAVIKGKNYKVIVANSFYPYIGSYTKTLWGTIISKYPHTMSVEEFLKTGSTKFDRVGKLVDGLPYIY